MPVSRSFNIQMLDILDFDKMFDILNFE
jgi:hypothetical protein